MPLFVRAGKNVRVPIPSLPGQFQLSVDQIVKECQELHEQRLPAVLLFGISQQKDEKASHAYAKDGMLQQAIQAIKAQVPELLVITDVCLCAYMSHGHCGVVKSRLPGLKSKGKSAKARPPQSERDFVIDNDASLELLAKTALSHAQAGVDVVAPSDMMDGRVAAIRKTLDVAGFSSVPIMSYAAKFSSSLYAPFREAVGSAPAFGDRKSYQLDPANGDEAVREALLDFQEGADIVMVKPASLYLDVIARIKQATSRPVAAFHVSGEYAMIKAASARGWLIERSTWLEVLLCIRRAGADILITYWAKEASKLLHEK